jgi:glycosyltransferase involved in cell wall biosynthesis
MKKRLMIFCDFYLPSVNSGGGMWTVVNLVERFFERYDFFIVTRNFDSRIDRTPYKTVETDQWNRVGNAEVFYFSPKNLNQNKFVELINEIRPDAVFLNSAFATPVIKILTARRKKKFEDVPVILAPCGEFSKGALSIKPLKKKLFLRLAKTFRLYENLIWKASGSAEEAEIKEVIGENINVFIAPDLVPKTILPDFSFEQKPFKEKGSVKFAFLSRVVRKKNIHFFLQCLQKIASGNVEFEVIGPIEDAEYWEDCRKIIKKLPENISVNVAGAFPNSEALNRLRESHFFVLPTLNENFGYVCIEALAAGSPLLISDQTMWSDVEKLSAGWSISLGDENLWLERINECIAMNDFEFRKMSQAARRYSEEWLADPENVLQNERVLSTALNENPKTVKNIS